ncbi:NUDIX hydrolase [Candidatus Micrarchaeota archaeon]|nr:NUDIX hydrolase [Candidatus Micrarchaeota archaeon]
MKTRRGVFAVVVDYKNNALVLHRVRTWKGWEVVKGGIDGKDSEKKCLENELREEIGLEKKDYLTIGRTNCLLTYQYPGSYRKKWGVDRARFSGWLVRTKKRRISLKNNPVKEHDAYKWLPLQKALKKLTRKSQKKAVKCVVKQLNL